MLNIERDDRPRATIYRSFKHHIVLRIRNYGPPPVLDANFSSHRDEVVQDAIDVFRGELRDFHLIRPLQNALVFKKERNRNHYFETTA